MTKPLAAAMQRAGARTGPARLYTLAVEACRAADGDIEAAAARVANAAQQDTELLVALAEHYCGTVLRDMRGGGQRIAETHTPNAAAQSSSPSPGSQSAPAERGGAGHLRHDTHRPNARAASEPSPIQRRAAASVAHMLARTVLDTCKTSDGRAWGDVGAHELDAMDLDGVRARAIKDRIGPLSNAQRFKPLRELITPEAFAEIIERTNDVRRGE